MAGLSSVDRGIDVILIIYACGAAVLNGKIKNLATIVDLWSYAKINGTIDPVIKGNYLGTMP